MNARIAAAALLAIAAGAGVTACGGSGTSAGHTPAKPKLSASAACSAFDTWYLAHASHVMNGQHVTDMAGLSAAVAKAPSGKLYREMSLYRTNLQTANTASGSLRTGEMGMVLLDAQQIVNYCQGVNPQS